MRKFITCFLAGLLCAGAAAAQTELTVYGIKGPSGVGLIRLFETPPDIPGFTVKMEALAQADLVAAKFIAGEALAGILPPNAAAKIAAGGKDIRIAAVTGEGMLSLLTSDPKVKSIASLKGKTVDVAGQGSTPDYVFRRILQKRGLDPDKDLTLRYSLAFPEIAQSLIAGRITTALLPEPFATMARKGNKNLRDAADVQDEWVKAGGQGNYPMTALAVSGPFAEAHPEAVSLLLAAVKDSIEWVRANPEAAGALVEKHGLGLKAPVIAAAIPKSAYAFTPAPEARLALEALFRAFLEYAPKSIGGALPPGAFYYP